MGGLGSGRGGKEEKKKERIPDSMGHHQPVLQYIVQRGGKAFRGENLKSESSKNG